MAATTAPLVWDFYRTVSAGELGGVVHYHDEQAQSLYLNDGISTATENVPEGHWKYSTLGSNIQITDDPYINMRLDHPSNGILYGSATDGSDLVFWRYIYAMDISDNMDSWDWTSQGDNAIAQFSGEVNNIGADIFNIDSTLFQPGARVRLAIRMGESAPYKIGVIWLDECNYDVTSETVDISGRNTVGYFLKDQTFDYDTEYTGVSSDIMARILTYAGIARYKIQPGTGTQPFKFRASQTLLDGIQIMLDYYTYPSRTWKILEMPDGEIYVGYDYWLASVMPNTHYSFDEGHDVFKRKTSKMADSAYSKIRVTGRDSENKDLEPIIMPVNTFPYWSIGAHRTKHLTAPDGLTQEQLQIWADSKAEAYQYVGIGENFVGPLRPHLIVGDIAEVVNDGVGTSLGLVTEVVHRFSRKDGFRTEFSVDSGGVATDGTSYEVYSRTASVNGFNRKQRIIDLVRYVSEK